MRLARSTIVFASPGADFRKPRGGRRTLRRARRVPGSGLLGRPRIPKPVTGRHAKATTWTTAGPIATAPRTASRASTGTLGIRHHSPPARAASAAPLARGMFMEPAARSISLWPHDVFGKPVSALSASCCGLKAHRVRPCDGRPAAPSRAFGRSADRLSARPRTTDPGRTRPGCIADGASRKPTGDVPMMADLGHDRGRTDDTVIGREGPLDAEVSSRRALGSGVMS